MPAMRLSFRYGDELIRVERVARAVDNGKVMIKVQPDCRVLVMAPPASTDAVVMAAVQKRSRWIYQQFRDFRQQQLHVRPRRYVSGESHYYLGKQYLLKVVSTAVDLQQVKLTRGRLEVAGRNLNPSVVRAALDDWYKARAREVFAKRLNALLDKALWVTETPPLRLQVMQTQWGSCSPQGRLTLNPHLVKASRDCIDYVILHELCHIAEHNHSERFYRLMHRVMPGWEKVKSRLDGMAFQLLEFRG